MQFLQLHLHLIPAPHRGCSAQAIVTKIIKQKVAYVDICLDPVIGQAIFEYDQFLAA